MPSTLFHYVVIAYRKVLCIVSCWSSLAAGAVFPAPHIYTNWLFCVHVPLNTNQSINQSIPSRIFCMELQLLQINSNKILVSSTPVWCDVLSYFQKCDTIDCWCCCCCLCYEQVMGKAEGSGENWHGHVTALTVAPEFRRLGLAAKLMHILEDISDK